LLSGEISKAFYIAVDTYSESLRLTEK